MAPKHARDDQPRERWPLNVTGDDPYASRRPATGQPPEAATVGASGRASAVADGGRAATVAEATRAEAPEAAEATDTDRRAGVDEREWVPDDGHAGAPAGNLYRAHGPYPDLEFGDTVLGGLHYTTVAPRRPVVDDRWARSLRTFARAMVWCLPGAVVLLALSSVFDWPTATSEPSLVSPGTWVVVTALGFGLWLLGVAALAALVAAGPGRPWGFAALIASSLGVALLLPVVGVTGLARPAIARTARSVTNDPEIAGTAARMQSGLLDHTVGRWLIVGGTVLLALGAVAVVGTILGSRVLSRHDGWLILTAVGLAVVAALSGWTFVFTLGAMVALAGVLGLAYTVSRIAPDGTPPPAY